MFKIITPMGFNFDRPVMSLMDIHSRGVDDGWLSKSAAVLTKEMSELRPEKGISFVHMCALGDSEMYGANRNGDAFPKSANVRKHDTFVKYAKWFHNHKNKPHLGHPIYGFVKHSAYNEDMGRVELIVGIDEAKDPDSIEKLARGEDLNVSMACRVPFDLCSICHNQAKNPNEYCGHIKESVTQFIDDGRQVAMINDDPTFFDISKVHRNADRIAFSLRKVASAGPGIVLSTDAARAYGVDQGSFLVGSPKLKGRLELLEKLAALEKHIEGTIKADPDKRRMAALMQSPVSDLSGVDQEHTQGVLGKLKQASVSLPIEDFFKLVMGSRYGEVEADLSLAKSAMDSVFSEAARDPEAFLNGVDNYEPIDTAVPNMVKIKVSEAVRNGSLTQNALMSRLPALVLCKKASVGPRQKVVTQRGMYLAREYARYKFAFLEKNQDPFVEQMSLVQNFGY